MSPADPAQAPAAIRAKLGACASTFGGEFRAEDLLVLER